MSFSVVLPRACLAQTRPSASHLLGSTQPWRPSRVSSTTYPTLSSHVLRSVSSGLTHQPSSSCDLSTLARRHYSQPQSPPPSTANAFPSKRQLPPNSRPSGSARPGPPRMAPYTIRPPVPPPPTRPAGDPSHSTESSPELESLRKAKLSSIHGKPKTAFSWAQERALYTLEIAARQHTIEQKDREASAKAGYIPLGRQRLSPTVEAWETDLAARTVTEKTIWAEFVVPQRDTSNMSDSSNAGDASSSSVDLAEPQLWRWYLVVPVALAGSAVIFFAAAYLSQFDYAPDGQPFPLMEWAGAVAYLIVPAWVIALASTAPARMAMTNLLQASAGGRERMSVHLDRFFLRHNLQSSADRAQLKLLRFRSSQIWTSAFAHSTFAHLYENFRLIAIFSFFAWGFFDHRSIILGSPTYDQRLKFDDNSGLVERLLRLLNPDSPREPGPDPNIGPTGMFHFLAFCLTAVAFANAVNLVHLAFTKLPATRKMLVESLQTPALRYAHRPVFQLDPASKKLVWTGPFLNKYLGNWSGLSDATYGLAVLALLQTTIGAWNPWYLLISWFQYRVARKCYRDARLAWMGTNDSGPLGHVPGMVFGALWFFFGMNVWNFFVELSGGEPVKMDYLPVDRRGAMETPAEPVANESSLSRTAETGSIQLSPSTSIIPETTALVAAPTSVDAISEDGSAATTATEPSVSPWRLW